MRLFLYSLFAILFFTLPVVHAKEQKNIYKAVIDADGVQRIEMLAGKHFFNPDYIIVKVGIPVELKIKKEAGIMPHSIVIKAPDAGIEVKESLSTNPKVLKFTPKKAGKYPFYCDKKLLFFKSHREEGMEGTIEVTE